MVLAAKVTEHGSSYSVCSAIAKGTVHALWLQEQRERERERERENGWEREQRSFSYVHVAAVDGAVGRPAGRQASVVSLTVPTAERRRLIALDTLDPRHKSCRPWLAYIFEFV